MTRIGGLCGVPWRGLLAAATVALALTVGLSPPVQAATRFVATTGNDSSNTCLSSSSPCKTITRALSQAVANDTISVAAGIYNTALGETFPLFITKNLTLTGAGAGSTIIDAMGANSRVIEIFGAVTPTISGVTITGGARSCSGLCGAFGGGLFTGVGNTLTLTNSTVTGNAASCTASGSNSSCVAFGGGLSNDFGETVTLTNSTVAGNTASCTASGGRSCSTAGGGLYNGGTLTLTNSTLSGNTASCIISGSGSCTAAGGGLLSEGTPMTVTNATVSANTVACSGAGCTAVGGGLFNHGITTLQNTIIAEQLAGPDCTDTGILTSNGFNLDSDNTCHLTQPSDKPNVTNPLLGPIQNNGGPTQTHALLPGSPAIDAVTSGCPPPNTDQRGVVRPQGAACDIGAYEFATSVTVPGIPTLSAWGLLGLAALLAGMMAVAMRRRRASRL